MNDIFCYFMISDVIFDVTISSYPFKKSKCHNFDTTIGFPSQKYSPIRILRLTHSLRKLRSCDPGSRGTFENLKKLWKLRNRSLISRMDVFNVANSFYSSEQFSRPVYFSLSTLHLDYSFSWEILVFVACSCKPLKYNYVKTLGNRKIASNFWRTFSSQ